MNEINPTPDDRASWADALVDRGLCESLGGDAPPDLRERILLAADQEGTLTPSAMEDSRMAAQHASPARRRIAYALTAAAACVVVGGLILPAFQAGREAAHRSPVEAAEASKGVETSSDQGLSTELGRKRRLAISEAAAGRVSAGTPIAGQSAAPTPDDFTVPRTAGVPHDAPASAETDSLMMMVTPQIVIEEQAERRLGKAANAVAGRAAAGEPFGQGLVGGGVTSSPAGESNATNAPAPHGAVPSTVQYGMPSDSGAQARFRMSDQQGQTYYLGVPFEVAGSTARGDVGLRAQGPSYGALAAEGRGVAIADLGDGASPAPLSRPEVIQELGNLQQELTELETLGKVARAGAASPAAIDAQIAAQLAADPQVRGYREQIFEFDSQLMQRRALDQRDGGDNAAQLAALQQQKQEAEATLREHLAVREREVRLEMAEHPDDALQSTLARYDAQQRRLRREIAQLEQQLGQGPGNGGDQYARIYDNPFKPVSAANSDNRLSTFSIDVDTAAYANVRQFLMQSHRLPPADAVRIEELVNYFDYDYAPPADETPFAAHVETAACPWNEAHRLVRIGIKGREIERRARPLTNLVFLVDVSGSMNQTNKLPLVVAGLRMLAAELGENDRVAIVVYASSEGLALPSTSGMKRDVILAALDRLRAGGSTAGGAGIQLAYQIAQDNFIDGGVNRVILCTDGDFNVGVTSTAELERMAETKAKDTGVFLTVLGFGRGNLNDAMMESISGKGNGNYHYVDNQTEARKVLVEEMTGTLITIAKDVKLQVEFNPAQVSGYRLIGYENRMLAAEDFNDDTKDAGEIGAGHTVTALYEVVPAGQTIDSPEVDALKYNAPASEASARGGAESTAEGVSSPPSNELLTLKIRYKQPDGDTSTKLEFPVVDSGQSFAEASEDFQFAAAAASFGMLLRNSPYKGQSSFAAVAEMAESASRDRDPHGRRSEFVELVNRAAELGGE